MSQPVKNPYLTLRPKPIGHELVAVVVEAPVKGRGLQVQKVKRQDDPEFFDLLFAVQRLPPENDASFFFALPEPVRTRLWDMGVFLDPKIVATPVFYACILDEEDLHDNREPLPKNLVVSPFFHYRPDEELPPHLRHRVRFNDRFLRGFSMAWVEDPALEMVFPYWIPEMLRNPVASLKPGERAPSVSKSLTRLFLEAGIFVPGGGLEQRIKAWSQYQESAWRDFALKKYAVMDGLLPPLHLKSLQDYFQAKIDAGWIHLGDYDSPLRYNAHNDDLIFFFQNQSTSLAGRIVGRPLKASHNHFISYLPGAILRKHVDRAEHRYGLSLLLDVRRQVSSESRKEATWPLVLHTGPAEKEVEIHQEIGEALIYDASEVPHSRRGPLPEGHVSSSFLLLFVPQEDQGPQEYSPFFY